MLWSSLNRLNNVLPYSRVDTRVEIRDFLVRDLDPCWSRLAPFASPTLKLSDLCWMALPWARLDAELDGLRVIDVGCGGGIVVDMRRPQRSPVSLALVIASHADRLLEAGWER